MNTTMILIVAAFVVIFRQALAFLIFAMPLRLYQKRAKSRKVLKDNKLQNISGGVTERV